MISGEHIIFSREDLKKGLENTKIEDIKLSYFNVDNIHIIMSKSLILFVDQKDKMKTVILRSRSTTVGLVVKI